MLYFFIFLWSWKIEDTGIVENVYFNMTSSGSASGYFLYYLYYSIILEMKMVYFCSKRKKGICSTFKFSKLSLVHSMILAGKPPEIYAVS